MKITLNIPDELLVEIRKQAERNTRTLTQEILHRIKSSQLIQVEVPLVSASSSMAVSEVDVPVSSIPDSLIDLEKKSWEIKEGLVNTVVNPVYKKGKKDFFEAVKDSPVSGGFTESEQRVVDNIIKIYGDGYQPDSEELRKLNREISDLGWSFNDQTRIMFKNMGGKWVVVKKF